MKLNNIVSVFLFLAVLVGVTSPVAAENEGSANRGQRMDAKVEKMEKRVTSTTAVPKEFDGACMGTAVEKRDNAIVTALKVYSDKSTAALTARRDALKAGWLLTDRTQIRTALRLAWKNFQTTHLQARREWMTGKRLAWKQFYTDRKACGRQTAAIDATTESADTQL